MSDVQLVRNILPARREVDARDRYTLYKPELRMDFHSSCGYCGDSDDRVDLSLFHIDHFAPKSLFPHLLLSYGNLVYACRFCNVSKSNHWVGDDPLIASTGDRGFVDPCSDDYELHFVRLDSGKITAKTPLGAYMLKKLKLSLLRHELLWRARRARSVREEIKALLTRCKDLNGATNQYVDLLERFVKLTESIEEYERGAVAG